MSTSGKAKHVSSVQKENNEYKIHHFLAKTTQIIKDLITKKRHLSGTGEKKVIQQKMAVVARLLSHTVVLKS